MKTDMYTKVVLTVIAVALTANLIKGSVSPAMADSKKSVTLPMNADGSINVHIIKSDTPMDVKIKEVDRYAFYYSEPIPVKVKN